jgi:AcrR family transcriptional regulator
VKILDAASRVLADFGFKRATVELVSKYAAVSHMTVYRRWSSKGDLLRFAVLRELSIVLDAAFDGAAHIESFDEQVVHAFGEVVWSVRGHPLLMRRELNTEPEVLLTTMSTGSGSIMETVVPLVAERLRRIADADANSANLAALADVFVRLAHSLVLVQHPDNPLETRTALDVYARRFFAPLAASSGAAAASGATPRARVPHQRLQLAAASLLAVVLVGAGLTAVFARQGGAPVLPDLMRTEQSPAPSVPPIATVPLIPPSTVAETTEQDAVSAPTVTAPVPSEESPVASDTPTFSSHPTTSRRPAGGDRGPVVGSPQRPPNPFPASPPVMFTPWQPPPGPGPSGPGPRPGPGPGGFGHGGHPSP